MKRQEELLKNPLFKLLVEERIELFNSEKKKLGQPLDFSGALLKGLDLRNIDASDINFENAYFRGADLRGIDFSKSNLHGASIAGAKVSGAYFPETIPAEEIRLSHELGSRMRMVKSRGG